MRVQALKRIQRSPAAFRSQLLIDADGKTVRFADVLDPFQRSDFAALDPALQRTIGHDVKTDHHRAWIERPRGHSKTMDLAILIVWCLFASKRRISGVAAAADQEQAGLLRDACSKLVQLNPWLAKFIDVQRTRIFNPHTESELKILSSDAASSYGLTPDIVICDELTHWKSRDLWDSLISSAAKRKSCTVVVITNAGFVDSWQFETREAIRETTTWYFNALPGPRASWITEDRLDEQKRLLPPKVFARLWLNRWADGSGDAIDNVNSAVTLTGPMQPELGYGFVAGLDLGISHDATAFVSLGAHVGHTETRTAPKRKLTPQQRTLIDAGIYPEPRRESTRIHHPGNGRLRLADVDIWKPEGARVDLTAVENAIIRQHERFNFSAISVDPWQAELLIQRLRRKGLPVYEVPFTGSNLQAMASAVLDGFRERNIDLFDCPELIADLKALRVVERSYGYRLQSPRATNTEGTRHGDTATALGLAMLAAKRFTLSPRAHVRGELVCYPLDLAG